MTELGTDTPTAARRRNASGESTRVMLMEVAERLFATRGIEAVTLREIQAAAGQSNTSVIRYHFGSREGLIRGLIAHRQHNLETDRQQMLEAMRAEGKEADPRAVIWLLVRPLANSIAAGEMFVPFLARLMEDPRARSDYWPDHLEDAWTQERLEDLVDGALQDLPERIRRGRTFQLYTSLINVLAAAARAGHGVGEAQLHNYVDAWVGMLTAPVSYETRGLIADQGDS
ncbi:TetR/AcrR family transcriptional regulator [Mycolicibacterium porcinum]|uniref:TetR/AcrR family transcriptional regulator n=1 Tax=Mycolicibacterium porcinum TaxID=39693 RepID=A0AAW5T0K5_9MYCO|nr:TetR/AcrR family transcriptional regulator [Mycolicibacterium porcinum]MCV7388042.1 TetR/AcrR family transcriptional regulator [Mycolicibacterium porcinum]ORB43770.1 TetR family transcriptional regulator [Mycolicibacterium porcinum]CDO31272.1 TetR family transcriptional regulator [Mycolicibacterium vulneris]